jgi:outer membrane protein assembly factor BamB
VEAQDRCLGALGTAGGNGTLYVGTNDGRMVALDAVSGEERWTAETGSPVFSTPAVADGVLHFGLQNGRLLGVRA